MKKQLPIVLLAATLLMSAGMASAQNWFFNWDGTTDITCVPTVEGNNAFFQGSALSNSVPVNGPSAGTNYFWEIVDNGGGGKAFRQVVNTNTGFRWYGYGSRPEYYRGPCDTFAVENLRPDRNAFTIAFRIKAENCTSSSAKVRFFNCEFETTVPNPFWPSGGAYEPYYTFRVEFSLKKDANNTDIWLVDRADNQLCKLKAGGTSGWHTIWATAELPPYPYTTTTCVYRLWADGTEVNWPDFDRGGWSDCEVGWTPTTDRYATLALDYLCYTYGAHAPGSIAIPAERGAVTNSLAVLKTYADGTPCELTNKIVTGIYLDQALGMTNYFVADADGSDGIRVQHNTGLSPKNLSGTPVALRVGDTVTVRGGLKSPACEIQVSAHEIIRTATGSGTVPFAPLERDNASLGAAYYQALLDNEPAQFLITPVTGVVSSLGGTNRMTDSGKNWTVNQWKNATVFLPGTANHTNLYYYIISNSVDTLTLSHRTIRPDFNIGPNILADGVQAGDSYEFVGGQPTGPRLDGRYVRTLGAVTATNGTGKYFDIDDGSALGEVRTLQDIWDTINYGGVWTPPAGLRVKWNGTMPAVGQWVSVKGCVGAERIKHQVSTTINGSPRDEVKVDKVYPLVAADSFTPWAIAVADDLGNIGEAGVTTNIPFATLLANDLYSGTIVGVGTPVNGTVSLGGGVVTFTATAAGPASFYYTNLSSAAQVTMTVSPGPPVVSAGADKAIAVGGSVGIGGSPTASGGTGPYTYLWSPATGLNDATIDNPTASPTTTTTYTVTVTNASGRTASDSMTVTVSGATPPAVTITAPKAKFETNNVLQASGTATDNVAVQSVQLRVNGGTWQAAVVNLANPKKATWTAALTLATGTNYVEARALDSSDISSATNGPIQCFLRVPGTLTVNIAGSGTGTVVTNVTANQLFVGRGGYKVTATAATDCVFSNWLASVDGGLTTTIVSTVKDYTFTMTTSLTLTAQFITNRAVGVYNGLVVDNNGAAHPSSGFFTVKVDSKQKFSGSLYVDGDKVGFAGELGVDGTGWSTMKEGKENRLKFGKSPVYVRLAVNYSGGDMISGIATNENWGTNQAWSSTLDGDRAVFNKDLLNCTNYAGTYTLVIPGANPVKGDSYALVTVGLDGKVKASGALAESAGGKPLKLGTLSTTIGKNGEWPFHVQKLYPEARTVLGKTYKEYQGSVMGWLTFTGNLVPLNRDLAGNVLWAKPAGLTNVWYTGGFSNAITTLGSPYVMPPIGWRALSPIPTDQATVGHTNGLTADFANTFDWLAGETANKLTALEGSLNEEESVAITAKSGKVKGTFFNGAVKTTEEGVLLQDANVGRGFYLGTSESGAMTLTPK